MAALKKWKEGGEVELTQKAHGHTQHAPQKDLTVYPSKKILGTSPCPKEDGRRVGAPIVDKR